MLTDKDVLEPILENPRMPQLIRELEARWKDEQRLRTEFYEKMQPGDKWEFINGKIIMHSPAKERHTEARKNLSYLLQTYVSIHDLGQIKDESALVSLTRNDYLPDILYFSKQKTATFTPDTWKYPIPDFLVEVLSESTEANDRGIKMTDYAAHGAQEYWLVDPSGQVVEQYLLDEANQQFWLFSKKNIEDRIACQVIKGFSIPVKAIFDDGLKIETVKIWLKEAS